MELKSQPMFEFFAAVNHLSGPVRKQNGFKRSWFVICDWWILIPCVFLCCVVFSVLQDSLLVIVTMTKNNSEGGFLTLELLCF